jgi:predicted transcriptional regulator of viral defense system
MKTATAPPKARHYVEQLAVSGRYDFSSTEARAALGTSAAAAKVALNRLVRQGVLASPARGFYVIVPPEYRSLGCLPADQFVPSLMARLHQPYYAGLLTAAQYHGAAHQRPQQFQVFLTRPRLPIHCGRVCVTFMVRRRLVDVATQTLNTPRGTVRISSPEATAIDLVGYQHRVGGLNQVVTVISELVEKLDAQRLVTAAATAPLPWSQRLGYLLDRLGASDRSGELKAFVHAHVHESAPLQTSTSTAMTRPRHHRFARDPEWMLEINADVNPDQ